MFSLSSNVSRNYAEREPHLYSLKSFPVQWCHSALLLLLLFVVITACTGMLRVTHSQDRATVCELWWCVCWPATKQTKPHSLTFRGHGLREIEGNGLEVFPDNSSTVCNVTLYWFIKNNLLHNEVQLQLEVQSNSQSVSVQTRMISLNSVLFGIQLVSDILGRECTGPRPHIQLT